MTPATTPIPGNPRSPVAGHLGVETYVLGTFHPALTRLPNGNLLMMVCIAEALKKPKFDGRIHNIRWCDGAYVLDAWPLDTSDPRKFLPNDGRWRVMALTSLSWLLPVGLTSDGLTVVAFLYGRAVHHRVISRCTASRMRGSARSAVIG